MDNASDPTITFDAEGRCNYCTDVLRRMPTEYFPNEEGKRRLDAMVAEIKETCKNDPYDCIVGVSGGIDSSYILYWGWTQGLRMLAVHIDDGLENACGIDRSGKVQKDKVIFGIGTVYKTIGSFLSLFGRGSQDIVGLSARIPELLHQQTLQTRGLFHIFYVPFTQSHHAVLGVVTIYHKHVLCLMVMEIAGKQHG